MDATLIIVDMQAGFMLNSSCKELIPRIRELLKGVTFTEVVTTKFINSKDSPFVKQLDYKRMLTDEDTRLLFPGYKTIKKSTYSALKYWKPKTKRVLVVGVDTEGCVAQTAIDCFEAGYDVSVLPYYCASSGGFQYHQAGLQILRRLIGQKGVEYWKYSP